MKKVNFMLATFVMFFIAQVSLAQTDTNEKADQAKRHEKVEALKRAYITDKLELMSQEAEKFWPVYNENNKQKSEIRKAIRENNKVLKDGGKSEKEAISAMEAITEKRKEEADLNLKAFKDYVSLLGAEKASKLVSSERDFQRNMMNSYKGKNNHRGNMKSGDRKPQQGQRGGNHPQPKNK